jgi:hypothetical protein
MAQVTGTTDTYRVGAAGGNREDLEDIIWELDPFDTYCLTNFDRVKAEATFHEHELDTLVAPTTNRQIEGDDAAFVTVVSPTRVGNYCQISRKTFLISRTQEKVAKAGRKSEVKRQLRKQMRELKNEMEYAICRNQASSSGGSGTARSMGSIESWIPTTDNGGNGVRATTSAAASTVGYSSGVVAAPTDGTTTGALTEGVFKAALELAWADGGDASSVLVGTTQKTAISGFAGVATKTHNVEGRTKPVIAGSVDVYVSEFGTHNIILHRHVRASIVLCIDPEYWATAFIDQPFMEELAKTGDGTKHQLIAEFTLVSRNHAANSKIVACA